MADEKRRLRELFLRSFVESLIFNIGPKSPEIAAGSFVGEDSGYIPGLGADAPNLRNINIVGPTKQQKINPGVEEIPMREGMISSPAQRGREVFPYARKQLIPPINIQPLITLAQGVEGTPIIKLVPFLNDPAVLGIECPGPGKNILVHKFGAIQTTPVVLMQKEIDEIMKNFSERTRIPIIQGVFKAALDNIIVTGIVSEFVGTRFYIEKIRAQQAQYGFRYRR